jgi:uncharacterized glyoxalase superfamily protein PhnB
MSDRPTLPEGASWLSPYLTVKDVRAAVDFYVKAFGFGTRSETAGPDELLLHAELTWKEIVIMVGAEGAFGNPTKAPVTSGMRSPVTLYVYCENVDAFFRKATDAGAKVAFKPADMFWGDRVCGLIDPDGHSWNFATNVADFDPSKAPFPTPEGE